MATPVFTINGSISFYGVKAEWQRVIKRKNADGSITYQPYALHTWTIPQMEVSTFLSLQALSGQRLTSLATTNINDVNNGATYSSVELSVVNCTQVGRRATGITASFRVDVS
jgi:hypothetical protein